MNSSGSLVPANAPAAAAQRDAMQRAFRAAGRTPQDVDFLELHATGMSATLRTAVMIAEPVYLHRYTHW